MAVRDQFFLGFRFTKPSSSKAGSEEGSGLRDPAPVGLIAPARSALVFCLLPWHLLLSITADLTN